MHNLYTKSDFKYKHKRLNTGSHMFIKKKIKVDGKAVVTRILITAVVPRLSFNAYVRKKPCGIVYTVKGRRGFDFGFILSTTTFRERHQRSDVPPLGGTVRNPSRLNSDAKWIAIVWLILCLVLVCEACSVSPAPRALRGKTPFHADCQVEQNIAMDPLPVNPGDPEGKVFQSAQRYPFLCRVPLSTG
ncbi:unnamed protein product [Gadus morhua 'NCC']